MVSRENGRFGCIAYVFWKPLVRRVVLFEVKALEGHVLRCIERLDPVDRSKTLEVGNEVHLRLSKQGSAASVLGIEGDLLHSLSLNALDCKLQRLLRCLPGFSRWNEGFSVRMLCRIRSTPNRDHAANRCIRPSAGRDWPWSVPYEQKVYSSAKAGSIARFPARAWWRSRGSTSSP